jgi:predicted nucleic acid-binding protein
MLVLDASAALAWIFERRDPQEAERANRVLAALAEQWVTVPDLWHVEVLNSLVTGHRRGVLSLSAALDFLAKIDNLPIATDSSPIAERKTHIFALAREYGLSAYDAAYLDLALRLGAALVSFDKKLVQAQEAAGVPSI